MVEKKEDATMTCQNCDTDLICRTKDYGGGFAPKLQWQNFDGTAHYNTKDGKTFTCIVPEDAETPEESATLQPKKETTTTPKLDIFDLEIKNTIKDESLILLAIRDEVLATVRVHEVDPNLGMIWEMTHAIWLKHFGDKK